MQFLNQDNKRQSLIEKLAFHLAIEINTCRTFKQSLMIAEKSKEVLKAIRLLKSGKEPFDNTVQNLALRFPKNSIIQNAIADLTGNRFKNMLLLKILGEIAKEKLDREGKHTRTELDFSEMVRQLVSRQKKTRIKIFDLCLN